MSDELTVTIASVPDRDDVVAELWVGDEQCGEVSREGSTLRLELYARPGGVPWRVAFDEFLEVLKEAAHGIATNPDEEPKT